MKTMEEVLIEHQRMDARTCLCGFDQLGASHAVHVADALRAEGFGPQRKIIFQEEEMKATIKKLSPRKWRAWCPHHMDGLNGTQAKTQQWADDHNKKEHGTGGSNE